MIILPALYDMAPVIIQDLMLSAYGLRLRYLRFGAQQQARLAELRSSERLPEMELRGLQIARLQAVTAAAARDVPFYRDRIPSGGVQSLDALRELPKLSKQEVQQAGRTLVSNKFVSTRLQEIHTGGTTGTPITVYCDREALQNNYAFFSRFCEWAGIASKDRVATFAGRTIVPQKRGAPFWRHNWASNALLFSSYHIGPDSVDAYLDALAEFRPALIDSYPSNLAPLAQRALARHDERIRPKAIITSSETLLPEVRALAEAAFGCKVFDHYGAAEMVAFIAQCEFGRYHVNPEYGIVEILVDGRPARPGECGELIATGFINSAMPFIRYATGDLAVAGEGGCPCGRAFPVIERIEGRCDDVIVTPTGRRIGRLDPIFKAVSGIHEARIVQDSVDHVRVDVVPWTALSLEDRDALLKELHRRLGPAMTISILEVERLERTPRGKLRSVISRIASPNSAVDGL